MKTVTDLDFDNKNSWQGALNMIYALCGEAADLSYDYRRFGALRLPTLEIRLDNPAELEEPILAERGGVRAERWNYGTVVLADTVPERLPDGPVWLLRSGGTAAAAYRAFLETVRVLRALYLPPEFSWSSLPLAPVCDDPELMRRRQADCFACGAIHTVWLRCPKDETVKSALRAMENCGQLRVQNMATANTWIVGKTDDAKILDGFRHMEGQRG